MIIVYSRVSYMTYVPLQISCRVPLTKYVSYDRHFIFINISRSRSLRPVDIEAKKREIRIFSPLPLSFSYKKLKREILQDLKVYIYHDTYYQKRLGGGHLDPSKYQAKKRIERVLGYLQIYNAISGVLMIVSYMIYL